MKNQLLLFSLAFTLATAPLVAQEYTLGFEIVNNTGIDLYGVFVTDTSEDNWGDDIIPSDLFESGSTVEVTIPIDDETLCNYDIRVTDEEQNSVEFNNIDFCDLNTLSFFVGSDGNIYYTVE